MGHLLRISVAGDTEQADLGVPDNVRVAELLPDLAVASGVAPVVGRLRLVSSTGQVFREEMTLAAQGVRDGQVLSLVADDPGHTRGFDDPVEEMAAAVTDAQLGWHPTLARPTALAVGVLALAIGEGALLLGNLSWTGAAAFVVASGLVLAAAALDRRRHEGIVALLAGWAGIAYATAGGQLMGGVALAGCSAAVVGAVLLRVLADRWLMVLPAVAAGGVLGVLGALDAHTSLDTGFLAAVALAGTVVLAPGIPRLALGIAESGLVGAKDLEATVTSGHDILRALQATAGLLALVLTPAVVRIGWAGALLATAAGLLQIIRARHHHSAAEVLVGIGFGVAGLGVAAGSVLLFWPAWAAYLGVGAALSGVLVPVHVLSGRTRSPRTALALDQAEALLLMAMLPLLVVSAGVLDIVRDLPWG